MEIFNQSHPTNVSAAAGDVVSTNPLEHYSTLEKTLIILVAGSLSLVTVIGNILVMLSIKVCVYMCVYNINLMRLN